MDPTLRRHTFRNNKIGRVTSTLMDSVDLTVAYGSSPSTMLGRPVARPEPGRSTWEGDHHPLPLTCRPGSRPKAVAQYNLWRATSQSSLSPALPTATWTSSPINHRSVKRASFPASPPPSLLGSVDSRSPTPTPPWYPMPVCRTARLAFSTPFPKPRSRRVLVP